MQLVSSDQSDEILELGLRIVQLLDLNDHGDMLACWMAHFVAEKMEEARVAVGVDKAKKSSECAEAILKLWKHRREFQEGKRPLEDFEPMLRTLQSLDPAVQEPRYFTSAKHAFDKNTKESVRRWLTFAEGLDHTARILIRFCLVKAIEDTERSPDEWLDGLGAPFGDGEDLIVIRRLVADAQVFNSITKEQKAQDRVQGLITRLAAFAELASALSTDLAADLEKIQKSG